MCAQKALAGLGRRYNIAKGLPRLSRPLSVASKGPPTRDDFAYFLDIQTRWRDNGESGLQAARRLPKVLIHICPPSYPLLLQICMDT